MLLVGWGLASLFRLVKGDEWFKKQKAVLGVGIDVARADTPPPPSYSTPFLAIWNGEKYEIENDFLIGKPRSYFSDFTEGKQEFEAHRVSPDLYKIQSDIKPKNGKLSFQIQEIEPEESFINGFELVRVTHPIGSEVVVDTEHRKFSVLNKELARKNLVRPLSVVNQSGENTVELTDERRMWNNRGREDVLLVKDKDYIDLTFKNISQQSIYSLLLNGRFRDWVMGGEHSSLAHAQFYMDSFALPKAVKKAAITSLAAFTFLASHKWLGVSSLLPIFAFMNCCASCTGDSDTGDTGKCFLVFYKNGAGKFCYIATVDPRAWNSSSELVEIPREAILDSNKLDLRICVTHTHYLNFIGLLQEKQEETSYKIESVPLKKAYHHRLKRDVRGLLSNQRGEYLHTIPGDLVDIEFDAPKTSLSAGQMETYLLRATGFYTGLSLMSKRIAGNWEERISDEARKWIREIGAAQRV